MPRFEVSLDRQGIALRVDGFTVPFTVIKDNKNGTVAALFIGGDERILYCLKRMNLTEREFPHGQGPEDWSD